VESELGQPDESGEELGGGEGSDVGSVGSAEIVEGILLGIVAEGSSLEGPVVVLLLSRDGIISGELLRPGASDGG